MILLDLYFDFCVLLNRGLTYFLHYFKNSVIALSKKFFSIIKYTKDLEILKSWTVNNQDIRRIYLANKQGKYYLYASYISMSDKDIGVFIQQGELQDIEQMNERSILDYWNGIFTS